MGIVPWEAVEDARWILALTDFYRSWVFAVHALVTAGLGRAWMFAGPHHLGFLMRVLSHAQWSPRRLAFASENNALIQMGRPLPDASWARIERVFLQSTHSGRIDDDLLDAILAEDHCEGAVLDPFCGHGSTLRAARRAGRFAIGIDAKEACCREALEQWDAMPSEPVVGLGADDRLVARNYRC